MTSPIDPLAALLVGDSAVMQHLRAFIRRVGPSRLPVFITGPTGAGKELVASALHCASERKGAFVAFNVCAVADTMFEDALFGHARGAFTGAFADAPGYLAEADAGTVFLDEIGGLPLASQAKLLRAIETQTFRAVGASRDRRSEFRVLAASNEDLHGMCDDGRFRHDLLHRLAGITLRVPPLSARREDIPQLIRVFLRQMAGETDVAVESGALDVLCACDWPGNVRQLKQIVELMFVLSEGKVIARDVVQAALATDYAPHPRCVRYGDRERELLVVMEETQWSVPTAADRLGVHRATIYRRLARMQNSKVPERDI